MLPDQQRLSAEERSNLVAYLDDELDEAGSAAIRAKLAASLTARRELDALRRTWELLDHLPRPEASDDFATRTVSAAIAHVGHGDRLASAAGNLTRRGAVALAWLAGSAVLFGLGYLATARLWPDPTARLARDLPIAESLDDYRDVGTIEFLERLDQAEEFNN